MKTILVSQRVEVIKDYGERRDCLDQRWCGFLLSCGLLPVPVMNRGQDIKALINMVTPAGILLTGGNDLASYGGDAPERDETERFLIELGVEHDLPVMGVCRGMQMIADYFGGKLGKISGHVARRHMLSGTVVREVNSYHNLAVTELPKDFEVLARAEDGAVEAIRHMRRRVMAIMWHPERETPCKAEDIALFTQFYQQNWRR